MLKTAVVVGLIAGLLVGGLHNIVTVPVIEEAIALEEAVALAAGEADGAEPVVSLGAQRVGRA
jgi:predicted cobalt transporter CbtA